MENSNRNTSQRRFEGEFIVDHRASPGNAKAPEGTLLERATFTCPHCHRIVLVEPLRTRQRHFCFKCDRYTCDTPGCVLECNNLWAFFEKERERLERELNVKEI